MLLLMVMSTKLLFSKNYKMRVIDVKNGLSQNTINTIYEDKFGLIWVGTNDGLNRLEGKEIKIFYSDLENDCSLKSDKVVDMQEDNRNRLWLATPSIGISFYNYKTNCFKYLDINYKNNQKLVQTIEVDTIHNMLWVATDGGGIFSYNYITNRKRDYYNRLDKEITSTEFKSIKKIGNYIYSGNSEGQLIEYDIELDNSKIFNITHSKIMNIENQGNKLLITTESDGYFLFDPKTNATFRKIVNLKERDEVPFNHIKSCFKINDSEFVMATLDGITYIKVVKDSIYITNRINNRNSNLDYNSFLSVIIDNKGTEWFGSNGFGLYYNNKYFNSFNIVMKKEGELSFSSIRSIKQIDDKLWVGGYGGLNKFDLNSSKVEYVPYAPLLDYKSRWESYISSQNIYCFLEDPLDPDIVWIGSEDNGLYKYSKSKNKYKFIKFNRLNDLFDKVNSVFSICEYDKNLILGTSNGLIAFEPKSETFALIESINTDLGKNNLHVRNMFIDGDLLYCVFDGVGTYTYSFLDAKLTPLSQYFPKVNISMFKNANSINKFDEKLILCTKEKGFYILNQKDSSFKNFYIGNGLNNNCVYQFLDDGENRLWVSTNKGISKVDLTTNLITNYDDKTFELNSEYNLNAAYKSSNNSLYFGGTDGYVNFNPESVINFDFTPNLIIKSVELNNKDSIYNYYFINNDTLTVQFIDDLIEIELMTDEYLFNRGIKYEYKTNNNNWKLGISYKIRLLNLTPGLNRIEIRVYNEKGEINQNLLFFIDQSDKVNLGNWISYLLLALVLVALFYLFNKYVIASKRKTSLLANKNEKLNSKLREVEKFKTLIENNISNVIWKTNKNYEFEYYTSNIFDYYGIKKSTELTSLSSIFLDDDIAELKEEIIKLKHFRKKIERKLFHKRSFKTINEYSETLLTINVNEKGEFDGLIGVVVDNKEKQKAKLQILEREELFSTLVSTILEPVLITNWNGEILFANNEAKNVLEITSNDISEKNLFDFLDDSLSHELRKDSYLVKNGESFEKKQYELIVNNKRKTIEGNGTQLTYFEKTVFLLTFRDVTQKIKLINELTIAKIDAERSSELKTMYLSNLTHELKTPINAISGFTDIIISKNENSIHKNYLDSIKSSANLLLQLINDLLFYTKAETGKLELRPVPTNIRNLVLEIENIFNLELKRKKLKFNKVINTNGIEHLLNIDQLKFKQILINLLNNSIKYTDQGKISLTIVLSSVSMSQVDLELTVEDTGKGIPKSRIKDIFSAFKQVNISDENVGFGLGLAIVKRILNNMNGTINVESELEKGSKFVVNIKNINLVINKTDSKEKTFEDQERLIDKIITSDNKLNIYSYELLDELQLMINGRFTSKLKNINTNFLLKDISEFAEQLNKTADDKGIDFLKMYSEELINATKLIEVEKINYLLENFYKLVELINKLMEKRNGN